MESQVDRIDFWLIVREKAQNSHTCPCNWTTTLCSDKHISDSQTSPRPIDCQSAYWF